MKDTGILDTEVNSEEFKRLYGAIQGRTVVTPDRLAILWKLAQNYRFLPAVEVGVYKGGSAFLIASVNVSAKVHLFDTFEGMPETNAKFDRHKKGDFADANYDDVKNFLSGFPNVNIHKGLVQDSLMNVPIWEGTLGFVHLDADIYESTLFCLNYFYPKLKVGGAILLDDYDFKTTPGCRTAVDEFLNGYPEVCINLGTGQGLIIKAGSYK